MPDPLLALPCLEFPLPCRELPALPWPELFALAFVPVLPEDRSPEVVLEVRIFVDPCTPTRVPERSRTLVRLDTPIPTLTPGRR